MLKIAHRTSIFSALMMTVGLKFLHVFHFLDWRPTKFLHNIPVPFFRYVLLALICYGLAMIIFLSTVAIQKAALAALLLAILITILCECVFMQHTIAWKNISISFFVLTIVNCRFIMDTGVFHYRQMKERSYRQS